MILVIAMVLVLLSAALPSSADSRSYIGSCANSFYTTSKITIVKDDYFEDVNIYAKLGSTSGPGTSYYSNLVLFNNQACTSINSHHQELLVSGNTHSWNRGNTSGTHYLKLTYSMLSYALYKENKIGFLVYPMVIYHLYMYSIVSFNNHFLDSMIPLSAFNLTMISRDPWAHLISIMIILIAAAAAIKFRGKKDRYVNSQE